ncbi:MAG: hypothetical protein WC994_04680 [Brumimicrobium sp.]
MIYKIILFSKAFIDYHHNEIYNSLKEQTLYVKQKTNGFTDTH